MIYQYKSVLTVEARAEMYNALKEIDRDYGTPRPWSGGICTYIPFRYEPYGHLPWEDLRRAIQYALENAAPALDRVIYLPDALVGQTYARDLGPCKRSKLRSLWLKNWVATGEAWTTDTLPEDAFKEAFEIDCGPVEATYDNLR